MINNFRIQFFIVVRNDIPKTNDIINLNRKLLVNVSRLQGYNLLNVFAKSLKTNQYGIKHHFPILCHEISRCLNTSHSLIDFFDMFSDCFETVVNNNITHK